eukprot:3136957-Pyramimonas_sp.AAC.1
MGRQPSRTGSTQAVVAMSSKGIPASTLLACARSLVSASYSATWRHRRRTSVLPFGDSIRRLRDHLEDLVSPVARASR